MQIVFRRTTRNGTAQLTFVGAERLATATQQSYTEVFVFRLDALALSVIATATWLAGWLGVCHSRYCIKTTKPI